MPAIFLTLFGFYNAIPDWLKKFIATILVLGVVFIAGDIRGRRVEHAKCEEQARRAQRAADAQDLQAEKEGRAQDLQITEALIQQNKVDDETIAKLQKQLASQPGSKCVYDKSTADPEPRGSRLRK
jgi:hypothetical protein